MAVFDSDLTSSARIRNAALEAFARDGVAATSIRDVAAAAGVSPGLVQHHFASKAALRVAVDEYVVAVATEALREVGDPDPGEDVVDVIAERINELIRNHHVALLYVARGVVDRDEAALRMFDALADLSRHQLAELKRRRRLRHGLDMEWGALHGLIINLGAVLLEPALTRQLGEPFLSHAALERWKVATTALLREGELRPPNGSRAR